VGGHAALGGTLQLIPVSGFQPRITDQLTLVIAQGGISGVFGNVPDPFGPLALRLIYGQNTVVLGFSVDFTPFAPFFLRNLSPIYPVTWRKSLPTA